MAKRRKKYFEKIKMWEIVYKGDLIAIEKHSANGYERAVRPPGVRLILKNAERKICMTREYRKEQEAFDYRLPGGKVCDLLSEYLLIRDDTKKLQEAVLSAAQVEGKEEVGVDEIAKLEILCKSVAGASVEWDLYFLTGDIISMSDQVLGGEELHHGIEVGFYTEEEISQMIQKNDIKEDRAISVLVRYLGKQGK